MIQILVCDKVYVTPEMKRKKLLYKIYFIISIFLIISLCTYCIYADYDRTKSEQVSQQILEELNIPIAVEENKEREEEEQQEDDASVKVENDVIVVVLNDDPREEVNVEELIIGTEEVVEEQNNAAAIPKLYKAKDGTEYYTIAVITIPKLNIQYPVLSTWNYDLLKNATCKYWGPNPNEIGNLCIIGHNYRNNLFFSKLDTLNNMDIIQITDMSGKTVEYAVYDKYVVEPTDNSCTSQNTNGAKEITLITCYNNGKQRTIIKAAEVVQ